MRIAILADIHGNLPAFEAALEHSARQRVDRLIIAGDLVVGAPDSLGCWQLARSLGCPIIRGNHERYVLTYGTPAAPASWTTAQFGPIRWATEQLPEEERAAIATLPLSFQVPELPELLVVHGSLRDDRDTVAAWTPEAEIDAMFPDVAAQLIVRGHNHQAQVRLWRERTIVTTGAVGLPLDGIPTAKYLVLERRASGWRIEHQSVAYDVAAALDRFTSTGYLEAAGPLAELYRREVATASFYVVPFLQAWDRWREQAPLPIEAALRRFLEHAG